MAANTLRERETTEIDLCDPLEHEKLFCRDPTVWMTEKLSAVKACKVSYHRLAPGQHLPLDEAMTKSCRRFWRLVRFDDSVERESCTSNLRVCCECGCFSLGNMQRAVREGQRSSHHPEVSTKNSRPTLGKCVVMCSCSHVPYTVSDCTSVMFHQLSCKRQRQKSTNFHQSSN